MRSQPKKPRRLWHAVVAALFTIGSVFTFAQSASAADAYQAIDALYSPNDYGHLHTTIDWQAANFGVLSGGYVKDDYSDGHGPYLHVFANTRTQTWQPSSCAIHATGGTGTTTGAGGCGWFGDNSTGYVYSVSVWVCNGGDSAGNNTVEGGCYGREYFNPILMGTSWGSSSLGTHSKPYGDVGCCYGPF